MSKCGICDYKIEGDVFLIRAVTNYEHEKCKCPDCGRLNNKNRNSSRKIRVCGICYYDYEQRSDSLGYVEDETIHLWDHTTPIQVMQDEFGSATGLHDLSEKSKKRSITIKLLGKEKKRYY